MGREGLLVVALWSQGEMQHRKPTERACFTLIVPVASALTIRVRARSKLSNRQMLWMMLRLGAPAVLHATVEAVGADRVSDEQPPRAVWLVVVRLQALGPPSGGLFLGE